jgi:Rrf2 family protein
MEAMADMGMHTGGRPVAVKDIVRRQDISPDFLEQILVQLRAAGFVRSLRGVGVGCAQGKSPSDIRMSEIAAVFEGPIDLIGCAGDASTCGRSVSDRFGSKWVNA